MMVFAGSMRGNVAKVATPFNAVVAIIAPDGCSGIRYGAAMYGTWLKQLLETSGKSQAEVARALTAKLGREINRDLINKVIKGRRRLQLDELQAAAAFFGVEQPLATARELIRVPEGQEFSPDPDFDDSLEVASGFARDVPFVPQVPGGRPEIDGRAGAGQGSVGESRVVALRAGGSVTGHRVVGEWVIPDAVYRGELHASPSGVFVIAVVGESMRPSLEPGDRIFVDGHQQAFSADGIYLIDDGDGEPRVKRLEKVLFSNPPEVVVRSDNPGHGDQTVRLANLRILGRVCGRLTRM